MNLERIKNDLSAGASYLGIDIADQAIRYVYIEKTGQGHVLRQAGKCPFNIETASSGSVTSAIEQVLEEHGLSPSRVFLSISLKDTVIHQVQLPPMSPKELEEVVTSEIEKIPIFYENRYDHVYRSYQSKEDSQKVVFAAIPHHTVEFLLEEIKNLELTFKHVEIVPLNLKGILPLQAEQDDSRAAKACHAILVVHDQCTYLSIIQDQQYKLVYKRPIGTDALAQNNEDPSNPLMVNWVAELKRTFKSYSSEHKEDDIKELFLVWDKNKVPQLDAQLQAQVAPLQVKVVTPGEIEEITATDPQALNPIYLLALTPMYYFIHRTKAEFPLQHFFKNFQVTEYFQTALKHAASVFVAITVLLWGFSFFLNHKAKQFVHETKKISVEYKVLETEAAELLQLQRDYETARKKLLEQATYVQQLNRVSWSQVLAVVASELPRELALSSFEFAESGQATIKGEAYNLESIAELIRGIDNSAILENGKFNYLREKGQDNEKVFDFGILARLQPPKEVKHE